MGDTKKKKKTTKKQRAKRRKVMFIVEIVILLILLAAVFVWLKLEKIDYNKLDEDDILMNDLDDSTDEVMGKYTVIALFGLDNRDNGTYESGNSDTIMLASINNDSKEVKLVSIYRDTYLNVKDDTYAKMNSAYQRGGPKQAIEALNTNLDLKITKYVASNSFTYYCRPHLSSGIWKTEYSVSIPAESRNPDRICSSGNYSGNCICYFSFCIQRTAACSGINWNRRRRSSGADGGKRLDHFFKNYFSSYQMGTALRNCALYSKGNGRIRGCFCIVWSSSGTDQYTASSCGNII